MQDLKANESRLRDINKVASELESEGLMAEEAPVMQAQVPSSCCRRKPSTALLTRQANFSLSSFSRCSSRSCSALLLARFIFSLYFGNVLLKLREVVF